MDEFILDLSIVARETVDSAVQEFQLSIFEDIEAVTKMTVKERSPAMRYVSKTHRIVFDLLFNKINLDPKIQIKYFDNKKNYQLADMLTKVRFRVTNGIIFFLCLTL